MKIFTIPFFIIGILCSPNIASAQKNSPQTVKKDTSALINLPYGQESERALSGSVSVIHNSAVSHSSVFSAANALYGKLPGLVVLQGTGEPGADAPQMYIRGVSTPAGKSPLVIVDGIERDINNVQIEDIESVTVLKDASASVIYGLKAANGVILVVTKRGSPGRIKVEGHAEYNVLTPIRLPKYVNSATYAQLYNQALQNDGQAALYTPQQLAGYQNGDPYYYPNVDWAKESLKNNTWANRLNLNVTGGDQTAQYFVSVGYNHVEGLYKNTDMNQGYSTNENLSTLPFRSNVDVRLRKNWSASLDLSGLVSEKNTPFNQTATIFEVINKYPSHLFPVYVQDKVYGGTSVYANNPVGYINSMGFKSIAGTVLNATIRTKYDLSDWIKGLSAGLSYATDNNFSTTDGWTKQFYVRELLGQDPATGNPLLSPPIGNSTAIAAFGPGSDTQDRRNTFEATVAFDPGLKGDHHLTSILIYHQDSEVPNAESPYKFQFISGRGNYGYKNRYFADFGLSYSGTEAFAPGHRFGFFPALGASWIISDESFMKNNKVFDFLKLRATAGRVGNADLLERFSYIRQYTGGSSYVFGNTNASQSGLTPGVVGSDAFTWETSNKADIGIETRIFKKLNISLTGFFEKRTGILVPENNIVPDIYGGDLPNINAGTVENKGLEALFTISEKSHKLNYNIGLNISYSANKYTYLPEVQQPYSYLYKQGQPIGQPYILQAIGFFSSAADISTSPVQTYGAVHPGDIKYKDVNNDGRIDDLDKVALKSTGLPKWDIGMQFGFNFKGFDLNGSMETQLGRSIYLGDSPYIFWPFYSNAAKITTYATQFWTPTTQATADYPRLSVSDNANNYRPSTLWYKNGDFLRLRELDFGYNIPAKLLNRFRTKGARVFVRGMNLFSLDHLGGYTDPESRNGYPAMKSVAAGFNVQF